MLTPLVKCYWQNEKDVYIIVNDQEAERENTRQLTVEQFQKRPVVNFLIKFEGFQWVASFALNPENLHPILRVEENLYENLVLAPPSTIIYRSEVANNFKGRVVSTTFNFIIGQEHIKAVASHDHRTETTALTLGKRKQIKRGKLKKMADSQILLTVPELSIKILTTLSPDGKCFELNVNGQNLWRLPYKYALSEDQGSKGDLKVSKVQFNEKDMIVPYPWDYTEFVTKILSLLQEEDPNKKIETMRIFNITQCSSSSLNELLDAATTYCCHNNGFKNLSISNIDTSQELTFDEYLLQRFVERTKNLEKLGLYSLYLMHPSSKKPSLKLASSIILSNKKNTITEIDL